MQQVPERYAHIPFNAIVRISREFNVCPYLIAAIGEHETQWGRLGLGRYGLYTGYGAFDHGPDFRFAGLETQIRGTAEIMSEWGMRPNRVTLERLRRGNRGEFGRIYATDPYWPDKVWRHYLRIRQAVDLDGFPADIPAEVEWENGEMELEVEEYGLKHRIIRVVAIILLVVLVIWGLMRMFR